MRKRNFKHNAIKRYLFEVLVSEIILSCLKFQSYKIFSNKDLDLGLEDREMREY